MGRGRTRVERHIPIAMRAVRIHEPGAIADVVVEEVATPRLLAGEALVRVHAAAITRGELGWAAGRLPATPSYEFSGVVAAVAPGGDVQVDEAVFGLTGFDRDGVAAEFAAVPGWFLGPKPRRLGHAESAALPLAALSA